MLTSCHSEGDKEIMHVCGIGTQHPAKGVHQPSDYCCTAAATGVNEQANERSCHETLKKDLTNGVLFSRFLSKSSYENKE